MSDDEAAYDDEELAQARALADALAGRPVEPRVADAVDAAELVALLKAPELSEPAETKVLEDVERALERARLGRRTRARLGLAAAAGTLALAAAALLVVRAGRQAAPQDAWVASTPAPEAPVAGAAPDPAATALRASQIAWLRAPTTESHAALDRALASYRAAQLDALAERYGR